MHKYLLVFLLSALLFPPAAGHCSTLPPSPPFLSTQTGRPPSSGEHHRRPRNIPNIYEHT